ncbi:SDR family NAD(P)-dependent oxidoreductase, partial [Pseudomonas syringae pv. tagetis]
LARSADKMAALAHRTGCVAHAIHVPDLAGLTALLQAHQNDVVVNKAGVDRPRTLHKADAEAIHLLIDLNHRAHFQNTTLSNPRKLKP